MTKLKTVISMMAVGGLILAGAEARASSISLGSLGTVLAGGGADWTYEYSFGNSTLQNGSFFTINDFGPATVVTPPIYPGVVGSWVFSQALLGVNSLPVVDDPAYLNATFTWVGGNNIIVPDALSTFVLHSPTPTLLFDLREYTSLDTSTTSGGLFSSKVTGPIRTPHLPSVPDTGTNMLMLGTVMIGLAGFRKSLTA